MTRLVIIMTPGVRTPGVMMITSRVMGIFRRDDKSRQEVLKLMGY